MSEATPPQPLPASGDLPRESPPVPPASVPGERVKPRLGLALKASAGAPPPGAPVAAGAAPKADPDLPPSASGAGGEPAGGGDAGPVNPSRTSAFAGSPSPVATHGGVVVPLFREGSDARNTTLLFIILAAVLVFGGGAAVIWLLTRPSPSPATVAAALPSPTPAAAPKEPTTVASPTAAPTPTPPPPINGPVHDLLALGPPPSAQAVEGDLTNPRTFRVIPEPGAHPEVIRFVEDARVSGVSAGNPPRALINGRMVRGGALVEPKLGIVFLGLDPARRVLVFRSAAGDVVRLEY